MASLRLQNMILSSARFLDRSVAFRSFFSWLPGRLQTVGLLRPPVALKMRAMDLLPCLTRCPLPSLQPVAGMKCKTVLRRRCKDCFFVRRRGRMYVDCKTHPRHKQRRL